MQHPSVLSHITVGSDGLLIAALATSRVNKVAALP